MGDVSVKIINRSEHPLPAYQTPGSAGMDLRANLIAPVSLSPMQRQMIPTGIFIQLPPGYEGQVRPRSGLAIKHGLTCLNSPGTVDSDYRGELKVILINLSNDVHVINNGDRIAQLILAKVEKVEWKSVDTIDESHRGENGFGHTGN